MYWLSLVIGLLLAAPAAPSWAHSGSLDAYGCHSNKQALGSAAKRECHADLLAGQVFTSLTAELKAYIAAQQHILAENTTAITLLQSQLAACNANCEAPRRSLTLMWNANTESDLAGYRVYCGTASGVYDVVRAIAVPQTMTPSYTVTGLAAGTTYYCAVTAYDTANNESPFSNEVTKEMP